MGRVRFASALPLSVRRMIRRIVQFMAKVRRTRAWPLLRPIARPAYRLVARAVGASGQQWIASSHARATGDGIRAAQPASAPMWALRQAERFRRRLFNLGFTERALAEMREQCERSRNPFLRRLVAGELALYYADRYRPVDARRALDYLQVAAGGEADPNRRRGLAILAAECHQGLGDVAAARQALAAELAADQPDPDVLLAAANLEQDPARRIDFLNRVVAHFGLGQVRLRDDAGAVLDRLTGIERQVLDEVGGPTVTVVVPAFNAAATVATALDSLSRQTWPHLEIIVVDDASTDQTVEIVTGFVERDPRFRLLRAERNRGTYVARNLALREASGEFVTCHDTDDWSHPEKIERQVRALLADSALIANTSQQARVAADMTFHRRGKPGYYLFPNTSSLMFRRVPVMESLGYWDSVRFGADAELQHRILHFFGDSAVANLPTGPLSLQRQRADSLTGDSAFGYHGYFVGARRDYYESYTKFHRSVRAPRYDFPQSERPFPVPAPMLPERPIRAHERRHFDVIIASDFRLAGGSSISSMEEVKVQKRMGLRTGLVQMAHYDVDPRRSVVGKVRDLLDGDRVQMIVYGERVSCDLLIIRYPPVLNDWQRYLPDIAAEHVRVIVNQPPMSDYGPEPALRYRLASCQEHLEQYFGQPGVWHPIGPLVRQALHQHHADELAAINLSDEDWVNVIDVDAWRRGTRPDRSAPIRIGRHSRDHELKWPATPDELSTIYPDSREYEVRILGGARTPIKMLGYQPDNWQVWDFDDVSPVEFLAALDVFVYYPNPRWVESFGRVILEAMAAGVPVVLPPVFRPLFSDSAVYAEPADVLTRVGELMDDGHYYSARADLAQRFVEKSFGHSRHIERIGRFVAQGHRGRNDRA